MKIDKVVMVTAAWCGPCKLMKPAMEQYTSDNAIPLTIVDVEEDTELVQKFSLSAVPTTLVYKNGEEWPEVIQGAFQPADHPVFTGE